MTMNRHEAFEELISASLHGDLTAEERARLDHHLDGCAQCRDTLAAFADQRRILAGLRHLSPPRDLGARVRAGVEGGSTAGLPWWRRPAAIFAGVGGGLAVVAGALLALVLLNGGPDGPNVGDPSPTSSTVAGLPSTTPAPTLPPVDEPAPTATPSESTSATPAPDPTPTPTPPAPEPDVYLAVTGEIDNQLMTVRDSADGSPVTEVAAPVSGPPIAAELSPDGDWLAFISPLGESGLNELRVTRVADLGEVESTMSVGDTVEIGQSVAGSPFLEQLFWSPDGRFLAYTLADDKEDGGTDVWLFRPSVGTPERLTDVGNAYAGSWTRDEDASRLWISTAGESPRSHLVTLDPDVGRIAALDPADSPYPAADNVFQPLVSSNGAWVIFWSGTMDRAGAEWLFTEGGAPWLANNQSDGDGGYEFGDARELFADVVIRRDAFSSAAITWGGGSDAYAVWDVAWTGTSQGSYPARERVYFGRALDAETITRDHALDADDLPGDAFVADVKVSPTGRHLVVTAARPRAGVLDTPRADLLLVTRNTGTVADLVEVLGSADDGWFGPAAFDAQP
jgi:hypothetical protein